MKMGHNTRQTQDTLVCDDITVFDTGERTSLGVISFFKTGAQ